MKCEQPIEWGVLADYWSAELDTERETAVEEHLLGCDECTAALDWVSRVATAAKEVVRGGNLPVVLSGPFLQKLAQDGLRIREYFVPPGTHVQCTVTQKDDLLIGRLQADLAGVTQLDAVLREVSGELRFRFPDIPFRAERGSEVVHNEPVGRAKASGVDNLVMQLVSVEAAGDRLVAEYTFHHTPTRE